MGNIVCTIKNIVLVTVINGSKYQGPIDKDGNELSDIQVKADFMLPDQRTYHCNNCQKSWDGSDTFDEVKKHLGTFPID